jgi:GH24 family phage-related lysozyme (muramidase)
MTNLKEAVALIRKYEGFSEKAFPSDEDGTYTIGYGTQYYPDGSPVKQGQWCTKEKALEYLCCEVKAIKGLLADLKLRLDSCAEQALISFVHSIGWKAFLYSNVIDCIQHDDWAGVAEEITHWIFDENHRVIGGLIERRREEVELLLREIDDSPWSSTEVLMKAFRNYTAAPYQVRAIRQLEENVNPYVLAEFANAFKVDEDPWLLAGSEELESLFAS